MKILVSGSAGFIGFHVSKKLLELGSEVIGLDNLNDYYDVQLKKDRLKELINRDRFSHYTIDLADRTAISEIFQAHRIQKIIHLAAQAGVRYSIENPHAYIDSNIVGFTNILEASRHNGIDHLVFASSSSVYGLNSKMPFSTKDRVDHPISLYAATKKSNELIAHCYSHLYEIPVTGLRFFTVYGPWGRPDMAMFIFTKAILDGKPIDIFSHGKMRRDFTYVDDIVEGVIRVADNPPKPNPNWTIENSDPSQSSAPYKIYNIGNNQPVELLNFIEILENALGKKAIKNFLPMQLGDVPETYADIDDLVHDVGFRPSTPIEVGIDLFTKWYKSYYKK